MNVFMIGNGLDLHYSLPTTYTSFLHTVEFLFESISIGEEFTSVKDVFSKENLQKKDSAIRRCFETYGEKYDAPLDPKLLEKVFGEALANSWFKYLIDSFDKEKGWIDFEREIREVIRIISTSLEKRCTKGHDVYLNVLQEDERTIQICESFKNIIFGDRTPFIYKEDAAYYPIIRDCLTEYPYGSGSFRVNKTAVANVMFNSLRDMVKMLATFLLLFVDYPVKNMIDFKDIETDELFERCNWNNSEILSFNYTHTMQLLYHKGITPPPVVYYIHGELNESLLPETSNIVLGIDSDKSDNLENMDVSFLKFKKYYQRVFYKTDLAYLDFLKEHDPANKEDYYDLYVIGHSLDVTDQEVIRECFARANSIFIFYYCEDNLSDLISNLVSVFGKQEFDDLRAKRKLQFHHIDCLKSEQVFSEQVSSSLALSPIPC